MSDVMEELKAKGTRYMFLKAALIGNLEERRKLLMDGWVLADLEKGYGDDQWRAKINVPRASGGYDEYVLEGKPREVLRKNIELSKRRLQGMLQARCPFCGENYYDRLLGVANTGNSAGKGWLKWKCRCGTALFALPGERPFGFERNDPELRELLRSAASQSRIDVSTEVFVTAAGYAAELEKFFRGVREVFLKSCIRDKQGRDWSFYIIAVHPTSRPRDFTELSWKGKVVLTLLNFGLEPEEIAACKEATALFLIWRSVGFLPRRDKVDFGLPLFSDGAAAVFALSDFAAPDEDLARKLELKNAEKEALADLWRVYLADRGSGFGPWRYQEEVMGKKDFGGVLMYDCLPPEPSDMASMRQYLVDVLEAGVRNAYDLVADFRAAVCAVSALSVQLGSTVRPSP